MSGLSGRAARAVTRGSHGGVRCDGSGYAGRARVESLTEEQAVAVCAAASELRARSCELGAARPRCYGHVVACVPQTGSESQCV